MSADKVEAQRVFAQLAACYPDAHCELDFETPLQLLIATILSAQCTDQRVNRVTPELFRRFPDAAALATAELSELERLVHSTGFYRNKAKAIRSCGQALIERHGGQVPAQLDALVELPGVARKTANLVLGSAFGVASGVVVDTHVKRVARRLGLTAQSDPVRVERDLQALAPTSEWIALAHRLIWHGRRVCLARKPNCDSCSLARLCPRIAVD
ncbi:MAG: endonuclease III [Deltaproteobacteria bacterium]|nr:endonuclease III [Deltaproteobacteria bacterium]